MTILRGDLFVEGSKFFTMASYNVGSQFKGASGRVDLGEMFSYGGSSYLLSYLVGTCSIGGKI